MKNFLTVGEVFDVKGGKRLPKGSSFSVTRTNHPYLRVVDFIQNGVNQVDIKYITEDIHEKIKRYTISEGEVYISIAGTIGIVGVIPAELNGANLTENAAKLIPKKGFKVYPKFLSYYLNSPSVQAIIKSKTMAVGVPKLALFRIQEIPFVNVSLDEQKKIAAVLDAADALRQKDKALIAKYEELNQSLFLNMFGDPVTNPKGWEVCTIREMVKEVKYGTSAKSEEDGDYAYLRMNNITYSGYMDYTDLKYINVSEKDKPKYIVKKGDVLFNRTNSKELVGKTGIIENNEVMVIAGYLIRVRTNELTNPYYLWVHLNSKWAKLTLVNMCKSIVGMANINAQELQDIKILKAPIELQNQFAERVQQIEKQKQLAQQSLQKSEELFNSLVQRAFKGELTKTMEPV